MSSNEEIVLIKTIENKYNTKDAKFIQSKISDIFREIIPLKRIYSIIDPNFNEDFEKESNFIKYGKNYLY